MQAGRLTHIIILASAIAGSGTTANAGILDGTPVTFRLDHRDPQFGNWTLLTASGIGGSGPVSFSTNNSVTATNDQIAVNFNESSIAGTFDVVVLPNLTITGVTVTQAGTDISGTTFDASRLTFDAAGIYLDVAGSWNTYDASGNNPSPLMLQITATSNTSDVPEPSAAVLLMSALGGLGFMRGRRDGK